MPWGVCQTLCRDLPRVEQSLNLHRFWKVLTEILVSLLCPLKIKKKKKSENYLWRAVISQASIFQTLTAKHWLPIKDGFIDCTTEDKVKSVFRNSMEIFVWKIMIFLGECSTWPEEKEWRGTKKSQGYILFSYCYESTEDLFKDRKPAHLPNTGDYWADFLPATQSLQFTLVATGWQCWSTLTSHIPCPAKGNARLQRSSLNWVSWINLKFEIPTLLISCD